MEYWSIGVLEYWSIGVLEYWSIGVVEWWSDGWARLPKDLSTIARLIQVPALFVW